MNTLELFFWRDDSCLGFITLTYWYQELHCTDLRNDNDSWTRLFRQSESCLPSYWCSWHEKKVRSLRFNRVANPSSLIHYIGDMPYSEMEVPHQTPWRGVIVHWSFWCPSLPDSSHKVNSLLFLIHLHSVQYR